MNNFNAIDAMKLCMAVIVIAIHTNPENSFSWNFGREIQKSIYNVAVPYFLWLQDSYCSGKFNFH